ncbi:hypothetical protein FIBSPDRAFT_868605, partial [Athelia psychrophila]
HFGVVQAGYREVLKTLPSPDDIPAAVQPMHTDGLLLRHLPRAARARHYQESTTL